MSSISNNSTIPNGFPSHLDGFMAWTGSDYVGKPELYVSNLNQDDISSIEKAISYFKGLEISRGLISPQTFPLPEELSKRLRGINNEVNSGRGFEVLRGLQPSKYSEEDNVILYAGLTSHVASHRAGFIDHIRYERTDEKSGENLRPTELPVRMNFHTDADAGNILSMFTQSMSRSGGNQHLSSFWRVYNTLAEENQAVLTMLADVWHWEKPNRADSARSNSVMRRPIIAHVDGKAQINFGSSFVAGHPKYPLSEDAPPLAEAQKMALDTLLAVAKQHSFQIDQEPGDILFVNNLSIMHARDAFIDDVDSKVQRHIIRLWLLDQETGWPIAKSLDYRHEGLYNTDPEMQKLLTLTERSAVARVERVTMDGTATSHD